MMSCCLSGRFLNTSKLLAIRTNATIVRVRFINKNVYKKDPEYTRNMPINQYASEKFHRSVRLYGWGNPEFGALGNQDFVKPLTMKRRAKDVNKPHRLHFGMHNNVTDVACGHNFTLFAATNNDHDYRVFGTGINTDSQIGYHCARKDHPLVLLAVPVPIQIPLQSTTTKVLRVACGRAHAIIVTDNEGVFSLGNNAFGQCCRPIVPEEIFEKSNLIYKVQGVNGKVVDAVCGQDHTLLLTENGEVYSSGWGADGQTGQGHYNSQGIPKQVIGDIVKEKIVQLSGTVDCILAISDKGDLFGWGNSEYGQLSMCTEETQSAISRHISVPSLGKIISAASGGTMCAIVNEKGLVYVWGYGILGQGPNVTALAELTLLPPPLFGRNELNPDVVVQKVTCGLSCFAAITDKGDLFMWGKNRGSCLGFGHNRDQFFPFRVSIPASVQKVSCGIEHTFALCHSFS